MSDKPYKIGELSKMTGKSVRALHLYEEMGLLDPERSEGGFRLYGKREYERVVWITKLQDLGFKLSQIQEMLDVVDTSVSAPAAMERVRERFSIKLHKTRIKIEKLQKLERDLIDSLTYLEGCESCHEPDLNACVNCADDRQRAPQPPLISGFHLHRSAPYPPGISPAAQDPYPAHLQMRYDPRYPRR